MGFKKRFTPWNWTKIYKGSPCDFFSHFLKVATSKNPEFGLIPNLAYLPNVDSVYVYVLSVLSVCGVCVCVCVVCVGVWVYS